MPRAHPQALNPAAGEQASVGAPADPVGDPNAHAVPLAEVRRELKIVAGAQLAGLRPGVRVPDRARYGGRRRRAPGRPIRASTSAPGARRADRRRSLVAVTNGVIVQEGISGFGPCGARPAGDRRPAQRPLHLLRARQAGARADRQRRPGRSADRRGRLRDRRDLVGPAPRDRDQRRQRPDAAAPATTRPRRRWSGCSSGSTPARRARGRRRRAAFAPVAAPGQPGRFVPASRNSWAAATTAP